ncbi:MAG TPA: sodium:proton antiporter [Lentisphaeria bacterium]|nr:MAG: sodium:proton antiporter [Lentisphaerae bacterium GWF2_38_69]HBM16345.1 sodium:proton antiporter [Lentisphaeria bacterium]
MHDLLSPLLQEFSLPLSNPVLIFSLILIIILLAPIILQKFHIPGIIGLIISGAIIGPYGINILAKTSAVDLFSTIGLLYIMFIAGLELDINEFKSYKYKSFLFGFFTFMFPLSIGFPVCYWLLDYSFNASLLVASMFATHTLVAYPIVSKLGLAKNQAVAVTVGGTILTDTAVLLILAIVLGNDKGTLDYLFWIKLGVSLIVFVLIVFLLLPKIAKWFFEKLESEKHAHYIFVLSAVFFSAFLAQSAGIEPIIGAFLAGLALNPLIPQSSALMNRIEFIGNSLFIPFFLISVGMLVDIRVIFHSPRAIIVAGVLTVVALSGKWIAALITQLIFRYSSSQRKLIFGLSSAHAAATLAVILVGYQANILNINVFNGTIILILITCLIASFITEKAAKRMALETEGEDVKEALKKISSNEHILIPVSDYSEVEKLLEFASLIKDRKSDNPISLLSVVPNNDEAEVNILKYQKKLNGITKHTSETEIQVETIATIDHNMVSGTVRISREILSDILVMAWQQKARFFDKLFGEKINSIVDDLPDKNIFVCRFVKPLINKDKIIFIAPPLTEKNYGFKVLVQKIARLAQEYTLPIIVFGEEKTHSAITDTLTKNNISVKPVYEIFRDWEDFLVLSREIDKNDMIILNSSRRDSLAYNPVLEKAPQKLEKHFKNNNMITVYTQQFENGSLRNPLTKTSFKSKS